MDLKGRHFLKLLDYTPEEIQYLLDLAAALKEKKKKGEPVDYFRGFLKKHLPEHAALLRWRLMTWEWELHIWTRPVPRSAKRKALKILQEYWDACMKESSIVVTVRKS